MKKKIFLLMLVFVLALGTVLAACNKDTDDQDPTPNPKANQMVYGFATTQNTSHSGLAFATIKTDADGNVSERFLDEAFIPNEWAKLTVQDALALGAEWDETTETKLVAGDAVMVANIASSGSWTAATAPTFYPRYIELNLGGTMQMYKAKLVTITNNSNAATPAEATETAVDGEPVASTHTNFEGTLFESNAAGCVRYYPVTEFGTNPATEAKSLENRLSTDYDFAKAYVETLRSYELDKTTPADKNTMAIRYVKDADTKIDTVRLAERKAFAAQNNTAEATTGRIAIGKAMKAEGDVDLTGGNLAYASTFFKRGSAYDTRTKVLPIAGGNLNLGGDIGTPDTQAGEVSTWEAVDRVYKAFIDKAGISNLTTAEVLKLEKDGNKWKYDFGTTGTAQVVTFASSFHTNIYLSVYLKAYAKLAAIV